MMDKAAIPASNVAVRLQARCCLTRIAEATNAGRAREVFFSYVNVDGIGAFGCPCHY
jgi:hypothetical protein